MDFVLEGDKSSMHVLNAVSPAFTQPAVLDTRLRTH
jgi:hypothetical protein